MTYRCWNCKRSMTATDVACRCGATTPDALERLLVKRSVTFVLLRA